MSNYSVESVLTDEALFNDFNWNRSSLIDFGDFMRNEGIKDKKPIVISIFLHEQRIYQVGLEGSSAENDVWVSRKVNTIKATKHASIYLRAQIEGEVKSRLGIENNLGDLAICGGGMPILKSNELVGIVVISGLPHYEDHLYIVDNFKKWSKNNGI